MKLFLATSISGHVDSISHQAKPEHRAFLEQILKDLRAIDGLEVFAAIEQENWRLNDVAPEVGVQADLAQIDQSDALIALLNPEISAGVQFEIGYAVGLGKRVVIARPMADELSYFNQGAVSAGLLTLVTFETAATLVQQLELVLQAPPDSPSSTIT